MVDRTAVHLADLDQMQGERLDCAAILTDQHEGFIPGALLDGDPAVNIVFADEIDCRRPGFAAVVTVLVGLPAEKSTSAASPAKPHGLTRNYAVVV